MEECELPIIIRNSSTQGQDPFGTLETPKTYSDLQEWFNTKQRANLFILNMEGKILDSRINITGVEALSQMNNLPAGMYILRVVTPGQFHNFKIIKS